MKYLVTSGCSFSKPGDFTKGTSQDPTTWPEHLALTLNTNQNVHLGVSSNGQELISRKVIQTINKLLKTTEPNDILVGIMWSTGDRRQFYIPNGYDKKHLLEPNPSPDNPHRWPEEDAQGKWHLQNAGFTNKFAATYYRNIFDTTQSIVNSYEHVLRTQWFLKLHNIKYFMSTINEYSFEGDWENSAQIDYLKDMVDWNKFLPAQLPWIKQHTAQWSKDEYFHPNPPQHKEYVHQVILPYLYQSYGIKKCLKPSKK